MKNKYIHTLADALLEDYLGNDNYNTNEAYDELDTINETVSEDDIAVFEMLDEVFAEALTESELDEGIKDKLKTVKNIVSRVLWAASKGAVAGFITALFNKLKSNPISGAIIGSLGDFTKEIMEILKERTAAKLAGEDTAEIDGRLIDIVGEEDGDYILDKADTVTPRTPIFSKPAVVNY